MKNKYNIDDNVRICDNHTNVIDCIVVSICLAGEDLRKNEYYHNKWKGRKQHSVISEMNRYITIDKAGKNRIVPEGFIYERI
jgi:hypothetical protein